MTAAQERRSRVIVSRGLWNGFEVFVEPPSASQSLRHFKFREDALAHAEELGRVQGWPVHDRTEALP